MSALASGPTLASADDIRTDFCAAMSDMYRREVPAYGTLMELVATVNERTLAADPDMRERLTASDNLDRISAERHGAIRVGTADELAMVRRVFAVMGMYPVGYYDLSVAGVPVHSTAFRPVGEAALKRNPFRVFTSLLRLELIADEELRGAAARLLGRRRIFTDGAVELMARAEANGGLGGSDARRFVAEVLETFRWHDRAVVDAQMYRRLHDAHRLVADVVSFKGPHINHLTPRTLDIDEVQALMPKHGIVPKAVIEGPPARKCPILLRQTSFKALEERIMFQGGTGSTSSGSHTARFGEIEQRGIALTPKGRALYDKLLDEVRAAITPAADGSNAAAYREVLALTFKSFPDDWDEIRRQRLGYFTYRLTDKGRAGGSRGTVDIETLIADGLMQCEPMVYEDFLPVSAAGIFQSNLGDQARQTMLASPSQQSFEAALGTRVRDEFAHYDRLERQSRQACLAALTQ